MDNLFYQDLSLNSLSGNVPNLNAPALRHLYLSHNLLEGDLPSTKDLDVLEDFFVDHNQFTGKPPKDFPGKLVSTLQLQGNNFDDELDNKICRLNVFDSGVLIDLAADCSICSCDGRLCAACSP